MFSFRSQQPHLSEAPIRGFFLLNVALPNPKMQAMALKNSVGAITFCRQVADAFIRSAARSKAFAMERARCCHL